MQLNDAHANSCTLMVHSVVWYIVIFNLKWMESPLGLSSHSQSARIGQCAILGKLGDLIL